MSGLWLLLGLHQLALAISGWGGIPGERQLRLTNGSSAYCEYQDTTSQSWAPHLSLHLAIDHVRSTSDIFGLVIGLTFKTVFAQPSPRRSVTECGSLNSIEPKRL